MIEVQERIVKRKSIKVTLIIWTIIISLLMIGHIIDNTYIRLIILTIATIVYINFDAEVKLYLLLYSIPFINFLRIGNENFSFLNIWMIILFLNLSIYKMSIQKVNIVMFMSLLVIVTINLQAIGFSGYVSVLLNLLLVFMICLIEYKDKFKINFEHISIFISLGFILSSIFGLIMRIISPDKLGSIKLLSAIQGEYSLKINRFTGLMVDPNYYAQGILISIACILVCIITIILNKSHRKNIKVYSLISILIMLLIFGIYSYSKMFIITTALIMSIFIIYIFSRKKNTFIKISILVILCSIIIFSMEGIEIIIQRLLSNGDITTGRSDILINSINIIEKSSIFNLLFGVGISGNVIIQKFGTALHNIYIESIASLGIIGMVIWGHILYIPTKKFNNFKVINLYKYLPLLIIVITGVALDGLWAKWHYFYIVIAITSIREIRLQKMG